MIFHVVLEQAEDGWIVALCPAFPGCVSQGRDEKEALENIKEAITAWLWAERSKGGQLHATATYPNHRGSLSSVCSCLVLLPPAAVLNSEVRTYQ